MIAFVAGVAAGAALNVDIDTVGQSWAAAAMLLMASGACASNYCQRRVLRGVYTRGLLVGMRLFPPNTHLHLEQPEPRTPSKNGEPEP